MKLRLAFAAGFMAVMAAGCGGEQTETATGSTIADSSDTDEDVATNEAPVSTTSTSLTSASTTTSIPRTSTSLSTVSTEPSQPATASPRPVSPKPSPATPTQTTLPPTTTSTFPPDVCAYGYLEGQVRDAVTDENLVGVEVTVTWHDPEGVVSQSRTSQIGLFSIPPQGCGAGENNWYVTGEAEVIRFELDGYQTEEIWWPVTGHGFDFYADVYMEPLSGGTSTTTPSTTTPSSSSTTATEP